VEFRPKSSIFVSSDHMAVSIAPLDNLDGDWQTLDGPGREVVLHAQLEKA